MATPRPTSSTSPSPWARCEEQGGRPWLGRREGFRFRRNHSSFRPPGVCRYAYVGIVGYEKRSFRSRRGGLFSSPDCIAPFAVLSTGFLVFIKNTATDDLIGGRRSILGEVRAFVPSTMAYGTLEVTLISAKDLKNVNLFTKMEVYAVASISGGDPRARHRTAVDRNGGRSPTWNATLCFAIPAAAALDPRVALHVLLRSERILGDRNVGEVFVPLKELLDGSAVPDNGDTKFVSYQVRRPTSGKPKGVLNLSYKVFDVATPPAEAATATATATAMLAGPSDSTKGAESSELGAKDWKGEVPVTAYPAPAAAAYAAPRAYPTAAVPYAAPPGYTAYGYAVPPGYGYGAPPPVAGYGYGYGAAPPPTAGYTTARTVQPRSGNFGMGLGAGLLGGALGGLLIGDMMADAAAYDAGFNAAMNF